MASPKLHLINTHQNFYGERSGLTHCGKEYFGTTATGSAIALMIANPDSQKDADKIDWKRDIGQLCKTCDLKGE